MSRKPEPGPEAPGFLSRARARVGRTITDEVVEAVCARIARGEFKKHACAAEGITAAGLRKAEDADPAIADAVDAAHAAGVELLRDRLNECGNETSEDGKVIRYGDTRRETWLLERFDRDAFSPPKQQVESKVDASVQGSASYAVLMTVEQARALAAPKIEPEDDE